MLESVCFLCNSEIHIKKFPLMFVKYRLPLMYQLPKG